MRSWRPEALTRSAAGRSAMRRLAAAPRPLLFLDLDGTLAPLLDQPDRARVPLRTRRALRALRRSGAEVVLVSGRSALAVRRIVGEPVDAILGDHGARVLAAGRLRPWIAVNQRRLNAAADLVEQHLGDRRRIWLERKDRSLAIHLRLPRGHADGRVRNIARLLRRSGLRVLEGHRVLDAQLPGVDKGVAVRRWLAGRDPDVVLYAGDDTTDRDAFLALRGRAITIVVGRRVAGAGLRTRDPASLADWLERLAALRQDLHR